jgi:hypothetical protein
MPVPLRIAAIDGVTLWRVGGLPYTVRVRIALRPDGTLCCTELQIEAEEVTSRGVRAIPLGTILDFIALALGGKDPGIKVPSAGQFTGSVSWRGEDDEFRRQIGELAPRPRRSAVTPQLLAEVADAYRELIAAGDRFPVNTLVRQRRKWSNGLIYGADRLRQLNREARKQGLLGPAMPGRAGEAPVKARRKRT